MITDSTFERRQRRSNGGLNPMSSEKVPYSLKISLHVTKPHIVDKVPLILSLKLFSF